MNYKRLPGFTLIELMIVVVIIAILSGIAIPSYRRYVTETRRSDAHIGIQKLANRLEKFFGYCNTYMTGSANFFTEAWPSTCPPVPANQGLGLADALTPDQHYLLTIAPDNIDGSCVLAGAACNGLGGATLLTCQRQCGYIITANPNGAGTTGRQVNDGSIRIDSRGKKQWDRNNDGDFSDSGEDKWR